MSAFVHYGLFEPEKLQKLMTMQKLVSVTDINYMQAHLSACDLAICLLIWPQQNAHDEYPASEKALYILQDAEKFYWVQPVKCFL